MRIREGEGVAIHTLDGLYSGRVARCDSESVTITGASFTTPGSAPQMLPASEVVILTRAIIAVHKP